MSDLRHMFTGLQYINPMRGAVYGPLAPLIAIAGSSAMAGSTALMAGGTILGALGAVQQGNASNAAASYEAKQLDAQAMTERASGQRAAIEETRQAELVQSRARAVGAASGGGVDAALAGAIAQEGKYRSLVSMWEGEERAVGREAQAAATRFDGAQQKKAGQINAFTTLLDGGSSLFAKYA